MTTYNDALFRTQFPEFANTTAYSAALIGAYWGVASVFVDAAGSPCSGLRASQLGLALNYLTAHVLVIGMQQGAGSAPGATVQPPGSSQGGFETSASIGEISVSKLAPPATDAWEWWLAQTPYGQALWALTSLLSVGGFSVGGSLERASFRKAGGVFW